MNLSNLLSPIRELTEYQRLRSAAGAGQLRAPLPSAARLPVLAALSVDRAAPVVLLVPRADRVLTVTQELAHWAPDLQVMAFPEADPLFYELQPWGNSTRRRRVETLSRLQRGERPVVVSSARALMVRTLAPVQLRSLTRTVRLGQDLELNEFASYLVGAGYESGSIVSAPGTFSRRGGILDLWPPACESPMRVELYGDRVDSIRLFDPASQRSHEPVSELQAVPAREGVPALLPAERLQSDGDDLPLEFYLPQIASVPYSLLDYLPRGGVVLLEDRAAIESVIAELEEQAIETRNQQLQAGRIEQGMPRPYLTIEEIDEALNRFGPIDFGMSGAPADLSLDQAFTPGPRFGGQLDPLLDFLARRRQDHESCVVVSRQASRLAELWSAHGSPRPVVSSLPQELIPGELYFLQGALSEGWSLEPSHLHLLTDAELFGWSRPRVRRRARPRTAAPESAYSDLRAGDLVVHVDFGIGVFAGLVARTLDDLEREYLLLSYAAGDQVYVPIHQADRVTRYVGADGAAPQLSRLGSQEWERVRKKASQAVEELARELLQLYAKRSTVVGHAFSPDTVWQSELEASFPYVETEDQLQALEAVKADMEGPRPMDRLICGDVGYGKTEVALRAAFKAVMDGKQVAMLVPTTVLAQQHYDTFRERLAAYPVEVEMLSRFRTSAETRTVLQRLAVGKVDIVIGTHRLLQHDVHFKELSLLIIDEEQRFGVTHKEHLKSMRTEVDVLTLTATPIPRTLYMALTGVRDISTIDTAPEDRLPVVTHSGPYDPAMVRTAVLRELERGGQVFFVHNRVRSIVSVAERLRKLLPEARVEIGHGQMPERELAEVMSAFNAGEVDVLLSTSIIESGLDIPNANTLIVDRADQFGLAQLYQLRGRVGRGSVRAYAYFFHRSSQRSTEEALKRLEIISEHSQLGAGYSIALRDLEMRGAGDVLGRRQHGQIAAVGFHYYTQLLGEAVRRLRAEGEARQMPDLPSVATPAQVTIDLPLASALNSEYVQDRGLRLQLYRRMAGLRSQDEIDQLRSELVDRFGEPPPEVENLLYQLRVKAMAAAAGLSGVVSENRQILLQPGPGRSEAVEFDSLGPDVRTSKRGYWLSSPQWRDRLLEVLAALAA